MNHIRIFDTTLRDGEQAPGFSMTPASKLRMARALATLRVDVIEARFAASSPSDAQSIMEIAGEVDGPTICSLARIKEAMNRASANQNFVSSPSARDRNDHFDARVDHRIGSSDDISFPHAPAWHRG